MKLTSRNLYEIKSVLRKVQLPYTIKGSFSRLQFGEFINDIDVEFRVSDIYKTILHIIESIPLDFVNMLCGFVDNIDITWKLSDDIQDIVDKISKFKEMYNIRYKSIIVSKTDVVKFNNFLYDNYILKWSRDEIISGVKEVNGVSYFLKDNVLSYNTVLKFLYEHKTKVRQIDIAVVDMSLKRKNHKDLLEKYVKGDYYNIVKNFFRKIDTEKYTNIKKEFFQDMYDLYQTNSRILDFEMLKKQNLKYNKQKLILLKHKLKEDSMCIYDKYINTLREKDRLFMQNNILTE